VTIGREELPTTRQDATTKATSSSSTSEWTTEGRALARTDVSVRRRRRLQPTHPPTRPPRYQHTLRRPLRPGRPATHPLLRRPRCRLQRPLQCLRLIRLWSPATHPLLHRLCRRLCRRLGHRLWHQLLPHRPYLPNSPPPSRHRTPPQTRVPFLLCSCRVRLVTRPQKRHAPKKPWYSSMTQATLRHAGPALTATIRLIVVVNRAPSLGSAGSASMGTPGRRSTAIHTAQLVHIHIAQPSPPRA